MLVAAVPILQEIFDIFQNLSQNEYNKTDNLVLPGKES